ALCQKRIVSLKCRRTRLTLLGQRQLSVLDGVIGITHCGDVLGLRAEADETREYWRHHYASSVVELKTQLKNTIPLLRAGIFDEIEEARATLVTFKQQKT